MFHETTSIMENKLTIIFIICFLTINSFAQETEHEEKKNLLAITIGYTYIPTGAAFDAEEADGIFVPSFGLDYFRRIHPRWELGLMADVELGEYLIIEKELHRENAILLAAVLSFNLTKHINFFAGGGMEFEKHENLGIIRLGGEYVFRLNKEWVISPGFFYDFKEGIDAWSLSVSFGKEF